MEQRGEQRLNVQTFDNRTIAISVFHQSLTRKKLALSPFSLMSVIQISRKKMEYEKSSAHPLFIRM